jgi:hypothetical protein
LGKNASVGFRRLQWYRLDKFKVLGFEKWVLVLWEECNTAKIFLLQDSEVGVDKWQKSHTMQILLSNLFAFKPYLWHYHKFLNMKLIKK